MKRSIRIFRKALKAFVLIRWPYLIDSGRYDEQIERFLDGDSLELSFHIELLANDVLFMRALVKEDINEVIIEKVKKLWKKEKLNGF